VSFQIESVVESLAADRTEVSFDVTVALDVSVQKSQQRERFAAHATTVLVVGDLDAY